MRFTITGGVCNGYRLNDGDTPLPLHFDLMWDAIHTRDKLNSGEWVRSEEFYVEQF